jgi:hypothetical protein
LTKWGGASARGRSKGAAPNRTGVNEYGWISDDKGAPILLWTCLVLAIRIEEMSDNKYNCPLWPRQGDIEHVWVFNELVHVTECSLSGQGNPLAPLSGAAQTQLVIALNSSVMAMVIRITLKSIPYPPHRMIESLSPRYLKVQSFFQEDRVPASVRL